MFTPYEVTNLLLLIYIGLLLASAYTDFRFFKIPNRFVLSILILYPAYVISNPEPVAWASALMAAGVLLVAGIVLFALKAMGAGDVKLIVAVSLWAGFENYLTLMVVTACVGVLLIPVSAFLTSLKFARAEAADSGGAGVLTGARTFRSALVGMRFVHLRGHWIPYGVAIAAAGIFIAGGKMTF